MKQKDFVKLFGVSDEEEILHAYHCSLKEQKGSRLLREGHIYLTHNYLCFYSHVFGHEQKIVLSWEDVTGLEKKSTAKIIPNAILVHLRGGKEVLFRNFLNRHEAFVVMERLWKKKQMNLQSGEIARLTQQKDLQQQLNRAMKLTASRYQVVDKLGEGGFGLVFVVLDKQDFRHYVLKEVCCENEEEVKDAMREMALLRLLRHPYIVKYKDFWQKKLHVFIVMEFCQGGDVSAIIEEEEPIPEDCIIKWLIQILLALAHIHSHNVLHRDIKPGNLFLNKWKDIKLGDFGLSTVRSNRKKQHQTPVGTMGYAAPELLRGKAYNEKSDMYSLGCCLYEMLTLQPICGDASVSIPRRYNPQLGEIMHLLMAEQDSKRPSAKNLLDHPFLKDEFRKIKIQSEIYAELQQREDEADELRFRVFVLQQEIHRLKPHARVIETADTNLPIRRHSVLLDESQSDDDVIARSSSSESDKQHPPSSKDHGDDRCKSKAKGPEPLNLHALVEGRKNKKHNEKLHGEEDQFDEDEDVGGYLEWKRKKEQEFRGWHTDRSHNRASEDEDTNGNTKRRNSIDA